MGRPRTKVRWTEEERHILSWAWPERHEDEVKRLLGDRFTLIAVRAQARLLGLKKSQDHKLRNRTSFALRQLAESRERVVELETAVKILRDRVRSLEKQLLTCAR